MSTTELPPPAAPAEQPRRPRTLTHVLKRNEIEVETKPLDMKLLVRMFRFAAPHKKKIYKVLTMAAIRSMQLPFVDLLWGTAMAAVAAHDMTKLPWAIAGYALWALVTQGTFHFRMRWAAELGELVVGDLRNAINKHLQTLSMSYFHRTPVGKSISRITNDAEMVRSGVAELLPVTLVNTGQVIIASAIMIYYDAWLYLVLVCMAPGMILFNRYYKKIISRIMRQVQESFSRVTSTVVESVTGIRVTQAFARQDTNAEMFRDLVTDHAAYNITQARTQSIYGPVLDFNHQLFVALLLLVAAYQIQHGTADPATLLKFFALSNSFFGPLNIIGNQYANSMQAMAGAERVFNLLDTKPEFSDPQDAVVLSDFKGKVEFRNLSFGYNPEKLVLQDVSFVAEAGQTIALVGHTGSGKTTIINLVSKFYLPTSGEIYLDGHEIRRVNSRSLLENIGIVLQVNFLFTGTVMENIRTGWPEATDEQVIAATERLGCRDLIEALPQGFQTVVGERGAGLSLGQRQLICFSRAMLADPRIFILDEATSSIDTITEHRVQQALQRLLKGRTCFVVAHRLSTIRHADQVLVMDQGKIIERGTHKQLLAMGGTYARLYRKFIRQQ